MSGLLSECAQPPKPSKNKPKGVLVFLVSLVLCWVFAAISIQDFLSHERSMMDRLIAEKSIQINKSISEMIYKAQSLAALVLNDDGKIHDFRRTAATIVDDPAILNVLIAPGGVVSDVYPLEGNEQVLGYNLLGPGAGNKEAIEAFKKGQLVFGGPFTLIQGGEALVGRYPVYLPDENGEKWFWGLVSVTLKYPEVLSGAGLESLQREGLGYEIWRINPDTQQRQIIAASDYPYKKNSYVERSIKILNTEWFFRIMPVSYWYEQPQSWLLIFAGLCASLMIALIVRNSFALKKMKSELKFLSCSDSLTGVYNRVGLFYQLQDMIMQKRPFLLYYLDIDHFKRISDACGHAAGDHVLREFCHRICRRLEKNQFLARISGDEFVLVHVFEAGSGKKPISLWEGISRDFSMPMYISSQENITLSFSVGCASFPEDGKNIDDIILTADERMCNNKNAKYAQKKMRRKSDSMYVLSKSPGQEGDADLLAGKKQMQSYFKL